ncbi:MAG: nucleoside triphosphate pyrophosphohydrolase [Synergistaceae bacterium]|nr:nucleoside triphosphate pyrophosphohydrolase [Synergistaceae bacterium]MBR0096805.1 nucleoside triphosphate pyrophosphohydrolase [Synergistaceae bacterium]MBR0222120.1 nucleoside triphosphate pyrophosphohydrolase [Synergistaceae bacterium]
MINPKDVQGGHYFDEIVNIIEVLRAPGGCPWDREQTLDTLRSSITEEAYELSDAISKKDFNDIKEEAGDLLLQVVFAASLAKSENKFDIKDVIRAVCDKLIRRHPHVFGEVNASDSTEVLKNWEKIKEKEREDKHKKDLSILSGVPDGLPPLLKAMKMQAKAAHVGFDWPDNQPEDLFNKLSEEINEFKEAAANKDADAMEDELGDVLFMAANIGHYFKVDSDAALSRACAKFKARFTLMEELAAQAGRPIYKGDYSLSELDALWDKAKEMLKAKQGE